MTDYYFTDREYGTRLRATVTIDERLWVGLHSLIETRIEDGSLGLRFPDVCSDPGNLPCGSDRSTYSRMFQAEVPWPEWPLRADQLPDTPIILDLLEFCTAAIGQPVQGAWQDFMRHYHLSWHREAGLAGFVVDANRLCARNGVAFEMTSEGKIQRNRDDILAN